MPKESLAYKSVDGVLYPGCNHLEPALIVVNVELGMSETQNSKSKYVHSVTLDLDK